MPPSDENRQRLVEEISIFAESVLAERAFTWNGDLPWANVEELAENDLLGINLPETYGGLGMTEYESILAIETIGRVCPDTAKFLISQQLIAPRAIDMFGSDALKERYLPGVTAGESFIAIAITEPEAGSDVKSMSTTVEEDGDDFMMNGEKTWVSDVPDAEAVVVWAKFDDQLGTVVVDLDDPGVEVLEHSTNMSGHAQSHFRLHDVPVPRENVLTRGRKAFKEQLKSLNWERMANVTLCHGIALCALDRTLEHAEQREQFGQPIGEFQGIKWKLADMARELEASRRFAHQIVSRANEQGRVPDALDANMAKVTATEVAGRVVDEALQIHGAAGYQQGHPMEYLYRLIRGTRISGGTNEVLRNTIANLLKRDGLPELV